MLTYQFIAGLHPDIKAKIAGSEGDFDELLVKARFEEANIRDFTTVGTRNFNTKPFTPPSHSDLPQSTGSSAFRDREQRPGPDFGRNRFSTSGGAKCYTCGSSGHLFRQCPFQGKGGPREAPG